MNEEIRIEKIHTIFFSKAKEMSVKNSLHIYFTFL